MYKHLEDTAVDNVVQSATRIQPGFNPLPPSSSSLPSLPLEVGLSKSNYGVWENAVSSLSWIWGGAPADRRFGAV